MQSSLSSNSNGSTHTVHHTQPRTTASPHMGHVPLAVARKIYLKVFVAGSLGIIIAIFAVFSIYWGALWKIPAHNLQGWIVDFDDGLIGQQVTQELNKPSPASHVTWSVVPADRFSSVRDVANAVLDEQTWVAITINPGASNRLSTSLNTPNATYDGSEAITVFASEARQENGYRSLIRPTIQASLEMISKQVAFQTVKQAASSSNLAAIMSTSPQTLIAPVSYQLVNLIPFDQPVASAVTFVGLIYQLILTFFIVMIASAAREASGLEKSLPTRSLIILRLVSSFTAYFVLSFFYSLLSVAFQLHMTRAFGHAGFLVFWMLNWVGMLSVGLALETMMTLLTIRFMPYFMITWIITNVSVCIYPIDVMPHIFRYGYGAPFYNVNRAMRTVIFNTKNQVGLNFGVLLVWVAVSCVTLATIQVWVKRSRKSTAVESTVEELRDDEKEAA